MIHSVYFWLRDDLTEAERSAFDSGVRALQDIAVVQRGFVGTPAATPERPVTDKSFSYFLQLEFASVADHDAYQVDPDHEKFVDACRTFWSKVVIYDSE